MKTLELLENLKDYKILKAFAFGIDIDEVDIKINSIKIEIIYSLCHN